MPEEQASQMGVGIGKRVRNYLVFFTGLVLILIWGNDILALVVKSVVGSKDEAELAYKVITSAITAIAGLAAMLLNIGRDINLHNILDDAIYHVRARTGAIIHTGMTDAARKAGAEGWQNMSGKKKEVMFLFYHFANEQTVLRDLAFTYWEQYFVNVYVISFGALGFVLSSIVVGLRGKLDVPAMIPLVFLFIAAVVGLSTKFSLIPKIYNLPVQQIEEITSSRADELRSEVKARFGGVVHESEPRYGATVRHPS